MVCLSEAETGTLEAGRERAVKEKLRERYLVTAPRHPRRRAGRHRIGGCRKRAQPQVEIGRELEKKGGTKLLLTLPSSSPRLVFTNGRSFVANARRRIANAGRLKREGAGRLSCRERAKFSPNFPFIDLARVSGRIQGGRIIGFDRIITQNNDLLCFLFKIKAKKMGLFGQFIPFFSTQ